MEHLDGVLAIRAVLMCHDARDTCGGFAAKPQCTVLRACYGCSIAVHDKVRCMLKCCAL